MSESEQKYTIYLFDNKLLLCEGKMEEFGSIKDKSTGVIPRIVHVWGSFGYGCGRASYCILCYFKFVGSQICDRINTQCYRQQFVPGFILFVKHATLDSQYFHSIIVAFTVCLSSFKIYVFSLRFK